MVITWPAFARRIAPPPCEALTGRSARRSALACLIGSSGVLTKHRARLHIELRDRRGGLTPEEREFAMTSAGILQVLETKARAPGREEEARRAVRVAFEYRFGPLPSILEAALAKVHDLDELHQCLQACLREPRDEVVRLLGAAVH
jgi:hypothetical protein